MEATSHYALGALTTAAAAPAVSRLLGFELSPVELAAGVAIGTIAGVLPDIDHPQSLITRGVLPLRGRGNGLALAIGQLLSIPPRFVGLFARSVFEHRGATHSLTFLALWSVAAAPLYGALGAGLVLIVSYALAVGGKLADSSDPISLDPAPATVWIIDHIPAVMPLVILCVSLGYLSHLLADGMTKAPIKALWPLKRRVFLLPKALRIDTGGRVECLLIRPAAVLGSIAVIAVQLGAPALVDRAPADKPAKHHAKHHHHPAKHHAKHQQQR